jgi:hypothetical protein
MASKKIDLNALRAARREASGEGPIVEFGDPAVEFTMPTELPFVVVEAVGRLNEAGDDDEAQNRVASGMLGDIARALFGERYKEFLGLRPSAQDVVALIGAVAEAYGTSEGESSASGES